MASMPTPAMTQPVSIAPGPATEPIFCGRAKMPEPRVDPMMRETSVAMVTVCAAGCPAGLRTVVPVVPGVPVLAA